MWNNNNNNNVYTIKIYVACVKFYEKTIGIFFPNILLERFHESFNLSARYQ